MHKKIVKKVFILGSGHCGSTLLDLLLDSHSKIIGLGEFQHLDRGVICTCNKFIYQCSFWKKIYNNSFIDGIGGQIFQKKKDFLLGRNIFFIHNSGKSKKLHSIDSYMNKTKEFILDIQNASSMNTIVSSTKNVHHTSLLLEYNFFDYMIIHLVRDGRAVVWSYYKKYKRFWPFAWKWLMENIKIEILKRRHKKVSYILIKYENLASNTESVLEDILNLMDLSYEDYMLDFRNFPHHQVGGNRMRLTTNKEIVVDESWKDEMPYRYRFLFFLFFGWMNLYYKIK